MRSKGLWVCIFWACGALRSSRDGERLLDIGEDIIVFRSDFNDTHAATESALIGKAEKILASTVPGKESKHRTSIRVNRGPAPLKSTMAALMPSSPSEETRRDMDILIANKTTTPGSIDTKSTPNPPNPKISHSTQHIPPLSLLEIEGHVSRAKPTGQVPEVVFKNDKRHVPEFKASQDGPEIGPYPEEGSGRHEGASREREDQRHVENKMAGVLKRIKDPILELEAEESIEILSAYELFSHYYERMPLISLHLKLLLFIFFLIGMIGNIGCFCLCFRMWQQQQRDEALRQAARLAVKEQRSKFNNVHINADEFADMLSSVLENEKLSSTSEEHFPNVKI
ncbi:hypothetical protein AAMO2058_000958900 [Amorphochlora amoebiformis]